MEFLSTIAEISIALAGFAGIAIVLNQAPGEWRPADALRIRMLLGSSLGCLFASLVVLASIWGGIAEPVAIRAGSAVCLGVLTYWFIQIRRGMRALPPEERSAFNPRVAVVTGLILCSGIASQAANVVLELGDLSRLLFAYGLLILLGWASWGFVRLLFKRPQ